MKELQPALSLLGIFESCDEAMAHLIGLAGGEQQAAEQGATLWEQARAAAQPVLPAPGLPEVRELPPATWDYLLSIPEHESFAPMVGGFRWSVRLVEIDPLFSVAVDLYAPVLDRWAKRLDGADLPAIVEACLPKKAAPLRITVGPSVAYALHADLSANWVLAPGHGLAPMIIKPPLAVRVAEVAGQYFLLDGYHRAVALRRLGHRFVPCLILHDCSWAWLRSTPRLTHFEPPVFARENPPCVGHFLTPAAVTTRAVQNVRILTMRVESLIAPLST